MLLWEEVLVLLASLCCRRRCLWSLPLPAGRLRIRTLSQAAGNSESLFLATDKSFAQTNLDVTSSLLLHLSLLHLLRVNEFSNNELEKRLSKNDFRKKRLSFYDKLFVFLMPFWELRRNIPMMFDRWRDLRFSFAISCREKPNCTSAYKKYFEFCHVFMKMKIDNCK